MRKILVLGLLVLALCAVATTASAAFGGPDPTTSVKIQVKY
ncbi:MAG TPA: hypothetical protein VGK74_19100 [Symbiobacteriaceae bacterium]|jgi:ABC-type cobalt transport system substrate-binding protein